MPRNSAFKKASKALAKTRDFFSYESPYLPVVPGSEACYGPCCASFGTVKLATTSSMVLPIARPNISSATSDSGQMPNTSYREGTTEADVSALDESGSCEDDGDGDDYNEHVIPDRRGALDKARRFCECKTCLMGRHASIVYKCDPKELAAHTAGKRTKERYRTATGKIPGWAEETKWKAHGLIQIEEDTLENKSIALALSIKELEEKILAVKDLRDVLRWACEQVIKVTIRLEEPALQQLLMTLSKSARAGRNERLKKDKSTNKRNKSKKDVIVKQDVINKVDASNEEINQEFNYATPLHSKTSPVISGKYEQSGTQNRSHSQEEDLQTLWSRSLLFTEIPPDFTKTEVSKLFGQYGMVEDCQIKFDTQTGASCGLGYVRMAGAHQADTAEKALRGMAINGCKIHVQKPSLELYQAIAGTNGGVRKTTLDNMGNPKGSRHLNHLEGGMQSKTNPMPHHNRTQKALDIVATEPTATRDISREELDIDIEDLPEIVVFKVQKFLEKHNYCIFGSPSSVHACSTGWVQGRSQASPADTHSSRRNKINSKLSGMTEYDHDRAGRQGKQLAVTKWDILRGLKLTAEEFLQIGAAMTDDQFGRFVDSSVMNAPNIPTGAYTILRNGLLAENIGGLLVQVRERGSNGGVSQSRSIPQDPITRRWKTLQRDFPDVPTMISNLRLLREEIQAWIASGRHMSSSCLCIVAADEKSKRAIAGALGDKDLHGPNDLAAFTRRLAEIDRDARFKLQKPDPADIDPREIRCKELLELCIKTIGGYPALSRLISLATDLPYHPSHEGHCNDD